MNSSLTRELATLTGILALTALRSPNKTRAGALALTSAALFLTSRLRQFKYAGKRVAITGGSRGLGLSLAWNLLERGATVTLIARDEPELIRGREILLRDYPNAQVHLQVCDITESVQLENCVWNTVHTMGGIDLWINNAGSILVGPFHTMKKEDFEAQIRLHLYAVIDATQLLVPYFQSQGGGRFLNICSIGGKVAVPHMLPYDVSKFALAGFSQGVTAELASQGIRVTTAYPTVMRTGSPIQAVFKGDHEKEFEWFQAFDNMPLLSLSADTAAKDMLDAVAEGRKEVVLSMPAKVRVLLGALFPEAMQVVMSLAARLLPKDLSPLRFTGADSQGLFASNPLLKPLQAKARKAEAMYNQVGHHDAEKNMGIKH